MVTERFYYMKISCCLFNEEEAGCKTICKLVVSWGIYISSCLLLLITFVFFQYFRVFRITVIDR